MKIEIVHEISAIPAEIWNGLVGDHPFQQHAFLDGLERCGCVGGDSGWTPAHIVLRAGDTICGVVAAYVKNHSMGEYVYDFSWARAAQSYGIPYYPKLVVTSPFSPVEGPRLHAKTSAYRLALAEAIPRVAQDLGCVGAHVLFPYSYECTLLENAGAFTRTGLQFHWENHSYKTFDDYLNDLRSRRRKEVRRERRAVTDAGITTRVLAGEEIPAAYTADIYTFYEQTHQNYGWTGYLNEAFFTHLHTYMRENLVFCGAYRGEALIGGAFCLRDAKRLYGRYWGAREDIDQLHFETALYGPIAWSIQEGIQVIEPGAGGQHKFRRGFMPRKTYSNHWHFEPAFHRALAEFSERERAAIDEHIQELTIQSTPFRRNDDEVTTREK